MKQLLYGVILAVLLAACQPAQPDALPTVAVLPSATDTTEPTTTPTIAATATLTHTPTLTSTATVSPTLKPSATRTPLPTLTFTPTFTATFTPSVTPRVTNTANPTLAIIASSTAAVIEAPTLATFTPIPAGANVAARPTSTGTPYVAAGVVITEAQFQEEVNIELAKEGLPVARIDFIQDAVNVEFTASSGDALTTATITFAFLLQRDPEGLNNFLLITITNIQMPNNQEPTEEFMGNVTDTLSPAVFTAFDRIFKQRLTTTAPDVENILITPDIMQVVLIVADQ